MECPCSQQTNTSRYAEKNYFIKSCIPISEQFTDILGPSFPVFKFFIFRFLFSFQFLFIILILILTFVLIIAQLRLTPQLARFMVKTPSLHRLTSAVTAVIIFFSVFSSILSTFGYIQFIPAVFAISGAATAWTSYSQTDLVLVQTNAAINQLNQLVIWWDALSMIEKRVGANKEFLVSVCGEGRMMCECCLWRDPLEGLHYDHYQHHFHVIAIAVASVSRM
jgi:hypothetical protein